MKIFNGGAWRPANKDARLAAANDLVQRTLAQHGLAPGGGGPAARMPGLEAMMERFSGREAAEPVLPEGARFEPGRFACSHGARDYRLYLPASASAGVTGVVMMLHGCTQDPVDFATGTGMNALAEAHGLAVVYPAQSRGDNAQSCWNWFSRGDQRRGRGEPAILAGLAREICAAHGLGRGQCFVAGLSAGAAMAVILGDTYGDVFSAVGAHSGLAAGSAKDVASAFAAMGGNPIEAAQTPPRDALRVRSIVFHGTADATVHPVNSEVITRRALVANGQAIIETETRGSAGGRGFKRTVAAPAGAAAILERWEIEGLGHAWSGGRPGGSHVDPAGPDASAEMIRFFLETEGQEA